MRSTTFPPSPLRAYRAGQGFSQADLAEVTGLSRETISRLEQGATPQLATAHAIATALGVPIGAIFPIQDESPACVPAPLTDRPGRADMTKDSPRLRFIGQRAASTQLEIDDWLAERKQALDALARREQLRLGEEVGS